MTSEEIKKAFDICCSTSTQSCTGCPILKIEKQNGHGCKYNLFISVIGLITEQEEEIKSLKAQLEQVRKEAAKEILKDLYFNLQSSVKCNIAKSNDYYNVMGWIQELAEEHGVEVEE